MNKKPQNQGLRNTDYIVWRITKAQRHEHNQHVRHVYSARPRQGSMSHEQQ